MRTPSNGRSGLNWSSFVEVDAYGSIWKMRKLSPGKVRQLDGGLPGWSLEYVTGL